MWIFYALYINLFVAVTYLAASLHFPPEIPNVLPQLNPSHPHLEWQKTWKRFNIGYPLQGRHNGHDGVSNHQPHHRLLNRLIRHRSKKISKLRVTGLCAGKSPVTGEFPAQMASNAENASIWWRHHIFYLHQFVTPVLNLGHVPKTVMMPT